MGSGWGGRKGPRVSYAVSYPVGRGVSILSDMGPLPHRKECGEVIDHSPEEIIAQWAGERVPGHLVQKMRDLTKSLRSSPQLMAEKG